jgi:CRISPR-associated protein Cmr3
MSMKHYAILGRDPLVFGDGRPISTEVSNRSVDVPWPTTLAGLVRTRAGLDSSGAFSITVPQALAIAVQGPWLLELDRETGAPKEFYLPAPRDVVWFSPEKGGDRAPKARIPLVPMRPIDGEFTDLREDLDVLGFAEKAPAGKAASGPAFWSWPALKRWLTEPPKEEPLKPESVGLNPAEREHRLHVGIDPEKHTAKDGVLFRTDGIRYRVKDEGEGLGRALALGFRAGQELEPGLCTLGGERRLGHLLALPGEPPFAKPPEIKLGARARVVLITPAAFAEGAVPERIAGAKVVAAAVPRPQVISGFSYETARGGPKPTRRLAPAGSVYWVKLSDVTNKQKWLEEVWMHSVSTNQQDQRDGLGLALVGVA